MEKHLKVQRILLNKIYANLIKNANEYLQSLNPERDIAIYNYINECLSRFLKIYEYAQVVLINSDALQQLGNLTFKDSAIDNEIFLLIESFVTRQSKTSAYSKIETLYVRIKKC